MGNMNLVTGYQGQEHVTAADHGSLYAAIFGSGSYVLDRGNKLAATLISSNQVRIADGDIVMQGRHARLNVGTTVDLTIESGTQGYKRNDLIAARYTRNASTGVEEASLVVIKGSPATSSPTDPGYNNGDILNASAEIADFPLYRIPLDGVTVGNPVKLFDVAYLVTLGSDKKVPATYLPSMDYIPNSQKGAANGVATLNGAGKISSDQLPSSNGIPISDKGIAGGVATLDSSGKVPSSQLQSYILASQRGVVNGVASLDSSGKVPSGQLPSMNYIPTSQKGAASGVAPLNASKAVPIANGGTGAVTVAGAVSNLGVIPTTKIGSANGVAPLNMMGMIDNAYLGKTGSGTLSVATIPGGTMHSGTLDYVCVGGIMLVCINVSVTFDSGVDYCEFNVTGLPSRKKLSNGIAMFGNAQVLITLYAGTYGPLRVERVDGENLPTSKNSFQIVLPALLS